MGVGLLGDSWVPGTAGTIADHFIVNYLGLERTWARLFDSSQSLNASEPATFEKPARYTIASFPPADSVSEEGDKAPVSLRSPAPMPMAATGGLL